MWGAIWGNALNRRGELRATIAPYWEAIKIEP